MYFLFTTLLFQPLLNALVALYNIIPGHDFGVAIIVLTLLVRLLFLPLSLKTFRSQRAMAILQPKLKAIQEKHAHDKQALGQATMSLYQEHKINPLSGCLPLLIQIPVLLALYRAMNAAFQPENFRLLYSFVHNPGTIQSISLGFINLANHNPVLAVTAGILQFGQLWLSLRMQPVANEKDQSPAVAMNKQLLYFFPVMVIIISWKLAAGIVIYWVITTLFSIFEQLFFKRYYGK